MEDDDDDNDNVNDDRNTSKKDKLSVEDSSKMPPFALMSSLM